MEKRDRERKLQTYPSNYRVYYIITMRLNRTFRAKNAILKWIKRYSQHLIKQ